MDGESLHSRFPAGSLKIADKSMPQSQESVPAKAHLSGLPKSCDYISLDNTSIAVILCREDEGFAEKAIKDSPSLILSSIAIIVSVIAFSISSRQQKYGLLRSIKDDFWLRTVISPTCITPLLELRAEILSSLPGAARTEPEIIDFSRETSLKISRLGTVISNLAVIDAGLVAEVQGHIELAEDAISQYLGKLGDHKNDPLSNPAPNEASCKSLISDHFFSALAPIKAHQLSEVQGSQASSKWQFVQRMFRRP
jgi:hypothetical protein